MNLTGQTLDDFQLQSVVAHGPRATIYRARQMPVSRIVAVKVYDESIDPDRVRRAFDSTEALTQANVLPVYGAGAHRGLGWVAMRQMPVGSLKSHWHGVVPMSDIARILPQVAAALDHAHDHDLLHLNLKPSNILLDHPGNAFVADFGIAPQADSPYAAPEVARGGQVDRRADVYALGAVLYEMLTGRAPAARRPHGGDRANARMVDLPSPRSIRPGIPAAIEDVVLKAMSIDPDARYATSGALAEAFAQVAEVESGEQPAPAMRTSPARWIGPGVIGLLLIAGAILVSNRSGAPAAAPSPTSAATQSLAPSAAPPAAPSVTPSPQPTRADTPTPAPTQRDAAAATEIATSTATSTPTATPRRWTPTPPFTVVSFARSPFPAGARAGSQLDLYFDAIVQPATGGSYGQLFAYLPVIDALVTKRIGAQVYSGAQVLHVTLVVDCALMPQPFTTDDVRLEIRSTDRDPALYSTTIPYTMMWCR